VYGLFESPIGIFGILVLRNAGPSPGSKEDSLSQTRREKGLGQSATNFRLGGRYVS